MDVKDSMVAWITTMHFFALEALSPNGQVLLARNSQSQRGPASSGAWWPMGMGQEPENLGNTLVIKDVPTTVNLGLHIVAYGVGMAKLDIRIALEKDREVALLYQQTPIQFQLLTREDTIGVVALDMAILDFTVKEIGLYSVAASIATGPMTQIPLRIVTRSDWSHQSSLTGL